MKKLIKAMYLAAGILIGVVGSITPQVIAATGTKTAVLTYRDIKIQIDGVETTIKSTESTTRSAAE